MSRKETGLEAKKVVSCSRGEWFVLFVVFYFVKYWMILVWYCIVRLYRLYFNMLIYVVFYRIVACYFDLVTNY